MSLRQRGHCINSLVSRPIMLSLNFSSQFGHKASKSNIGFLSFDRKAHLVGGELHILKRKLRISDPVYLVRNHASLICHPAVAGFGMRIIPAALSAQLGFES